MKLILIALFMLSSSAFAGITAAPSYLKMKRMNPDQYPARSQLFLCERGRCLGLVTRGGYTPRQWREVYQGCSGMKKQKYLRWGIILVGKIADYSGVPGFIADHFVDIAAIKEEDAHAMGLFHNKAVYTVSPDNMELGTEEYYNLIQGIKKCNERYQDKMAHREMGLRLMNK